MPLWTCGHFPSESHFCHYNAFPLFYFISVSEQILKSYRPIPIWPKIGRYTDIPITDMKLKQHQILNNHKERKCNKKHCDDFNNEIEKLQANFMSLIIFSINDYNKLCNILLQVRVPDVEFFINLGDWPLEKRDPEDDPLPILSWCGSTETRDIVPPTYDLTESTLETMGR